MKIRMLVAISGSRGAAGSAWPGVGDVIELSDADGAHMCAAGLAAPVVEDRVEKAVPADEAETRTATKRTRSRTPRP